MAKKSKKGEVLRSETLTVRLTPKIKYGLELQARKQHRTLAGVVEWAIERGLNDEVDGLTKKITVESDSGNVEGRNYNLLEYVWDPNEAKRLCLLGTFAPELMTYEEQKIWAFIAQNAYYWRVGGTSLENEEVIYTWMANVPTLFIEERVADDLNILKDIVYNEQKPDILPIWIPGNKLYTDKADEYRYAFKTDQATDENFYKSKLIRFNPYGESEHEKIELETLKIYKNMEEVLSSSEEGKKLLQELKEKYPLLNFTF